MSNYEIIASQKLKKKKGEIELTSLSGAHSSSLQSSSSEEALTVNNKLEFRLVTLWCFMKNLRVENAQVLAAKVACNAQAIMGKSRRSQRCDEMRC